MMIFVSARRGRWVAGCVVTVATLMVPAPAAADWQDTYKAAIIEHRAKRWAAAARLFEQARAENPTETGRVTITGAGDIEPYLPSYYLGDSLFQAGDCDGAMAAWSRAEQIQAVRSDRSQMTRISTSREKCGGSPAWLQALQNAESAQQAAERSRERALVGVKDADAADVKSLAALREQAQRTLAGAEARLSEARPASNAAAAAESARQFETAGAQFRDYEQKLREAAKVRVATRAANEAAAKSKAEGYQNARRGVQAIIEQAATAERSAANAGVGAGALQPARTQLTNARAALVRADRDSDESELQNAQRSASASRDGFQAAETQFRQELQIRLASARSAVEEAGALQRRLMEVSGNALPNAEVTALSADLDRARDALSAPAASAADVDAASRIAGNAQQLFNREIAAALNRNFSAALDDAQKQLARASTEFGRMQSVMRGAGNRVSAEDTKRAAGIGTRIDGERSTLEQGRAAQDAVMVAGVGHRALAITREIGALVQPIQARLAAAIGIPPDLNAAAREFFAGRYRDAQMALTRLEVTSAMSPAVQTQIALFRAATSFALYIHTGERDASLKDAAAAAVRDAHKLQPAYSPDATAFSPRFLRFYRSPG